MKRLSIAAAVLAAVFCALPGAAQRAAGDAPPARTIPPGELKSGFEFLGPDLKAMQKDDFANPGMLWVERGAKLWAQAAGPRAASCASCHGDAATSMKGVAARYPRIDAASGRLMTVESRIRECRSERQGASPFAYESDELLSLASYVNHQSRGMPIDVSIDGAARPHFERGRALYYRRLGQLNLACTHCHDRNWGRTLLAERISQGHPNAYPAYRLSWQTVGSLERRLRACLSGVRAEMFPYGSEEHADLALYLAWRARGLPIETPGVRR